MTLKLMLAAILSLPTFREDIDSPAKPAQLEVLAAGIAQASVGRPKPARDWAALVAAIAWHESGFSLRIHDGHCKPHECDRGRARGLWQNHKNLYTAPHWDKLIGTEHSALQAKIAADMLERSYWYCARSGAPWLVGTINAYAGRACAAQWPGLQQRLATFARVRARLG